MEFANTIKRLRRKANLTQQTLAEKLGVSPQSVSKWETGITMPDIAILPALSETLGVSIDDLFGLSVEQKLTRIENRMDIEEELPADVFLEFEAFLKEEKKGKEHEKRATELLARLYWDRMRTYAKKVRIHAKEAILRTPGEKNCQWMLNMAEGHTVYDWNLANHNQAISFYEEVVKENPTTRLPYYYLVDNLLADHRADEAEEILNKMKTMDGVNPFIVEVYQANIALARFDKKKADAIIEKLLKENPEDSLVLFEAAQYHAKCAEYQKAVAIYEHAHEVDPQRPRFSDALMGIVDILEIQKEYAKAAKAEQRVIDLLKEEWKLPEEDTEYQAALLRKRKLLEKAEKAR